MSPLNSIWYWRMAIWKLLNGSLKVGLMAYIGATSAVDWESMHPHERNLIILTTIVAVVTFIDAFIDQTSKQLSDALPRQQQQIEPQPKKVEDKTNETEIK